jgi:hypothetical protein
MMRSPGQNKLQVFTRNELTKLHEKKRTAEEQVREATDEIAKLGQWHLNMHIISHQLAHERRVIDEVARNRVTWTWYTQDGYVTNFEQVTDESTWYIQEGRESWPELADPTTNLRDSHNQRNASE